MDGSNNGKTRFVIARSGCYLLTIIVIGTRFALLVIGVYWIETHHISEHELKAMRQAIDNETHVSSETTTSTDTNDETRVGEQVASLEVEKLKPAPIIICNHLSYFDPLIAMSQFGVVSIVGKLGVKKLFLVGRICDAIDSFYAGQGASVAIKKRVQDYYASSDDSLSPRRILIYPESTTTIGTTMLQFHKVCFINTV